MTSCIFINQYTPDKFVIFVHMPKSQRRMYFVNSSLYDISDVPNPFGKGIKASNRITYILPWDVNSRSHYVSFY